MCNIEERKKGKLTIVSVAFDGEEYSLSRPCFHCCCSIEKFGIENVIFYDGEKWVKEKVVDVDSKLSSGDKFHCTVRAKRFRNVLP